MKIFLAPNISNNNPTIKVQSVVDSPKIIMLKNDVCSFTGSAAYEASQDKEICFRQSKKIMKSFKSFSAADYDKLSKIDIKELRKTRSNFFFDRDVKQILFSYKVFKKNLDTAYPKGCVFVSIGRSPACFAKMLQDEGREVKFCPSISLNKYSEISNDYKKSYSNYLKSIGITNEMIEKSDKPFVFADYTDTGDSLTNFEKMLNDSHIGIKESPKVRFVSMNKELFEPKESRLISKFPYFKKIIHEKNAAKMENIEQSYFSLSRIKLYSPIPHFEKDKRMDIESLAQFHKESFESKLMSFHVIDYFKCQKNVLKRVIR